MAIQRIEGFDHFDDLGPLPPDLFAKGITALPATVVAYSAGQIAGNAINLAADGDIIGIPYTTAKAESFISFNFKCTTLPGSEAEMVEWHSSDTGTGNAHVTLYVLSTGALEIRRDATVLGTTSASTITAGTWSFIEVQLICNNTTGAFDIHVDGSTVDSDTAIDTTEATSTDYEINAVRLMGATGLTFLYDDFSIIDTVATSGHPVTFMGPTAVATLFPDGDGTTSDFTGVGPGSVNYDRMDESPGPDFDTSYVHDTVAGSIDLYTMDAIPGGYAGSTPLAVQTTVLARKDSPGSKTARSRVLSNVTAATGTTHELPDNYQYLPPYIMVVDPDTSVAWDAAGINALECGWELVT